jgi:hypothetical protein
MIDPDDESVFVTGQRTLFHIPVRRRRTKRALTRSSFFRRWWVRPNKTIGRLAGRHCRHFLTPCSVGPVIQGRNSFVCQYDDWTHASTPPPPDGRRNKYGVDRSPCRAVQLPRRRGGGDNLDDPRNSDNGSATSSAGNNGCHRHHTAVTRWGNRILHREIQILGIV